MAVKTVNTRIQLKNDTEANWNRAVNFIPLPGEVIIYSADDTHPFSRLKVGNGETRVSALPFIDAGTIDGESFSDAIITGANRYAFPSIGEENKLYVDLSTNTIYCYKSTGGFTQLSHFTYRARKTQIATINNWDPGTMTTAQVQGISLDISNGSIPVLDLGTLNIVTDIEEVINNAE